MSSTMATGHVATHSDHTHATDALRRTVLIAGRVSFGLIFLMSGWTHFLPGTIQYAASTGLPFAGFLVPASGVLAALGALSLITGWHARIGAWMIVAFLVPVTLTMHAFWNVTDPNMHAMQMAMFMKNVSMFGAALVFTQLGVGAGRPLRR